METAGVSCSVYVTTECRYGLGPNGLVAFGVETDAFFDRYKTLSETVTVIARMKSQILPEDNLSCDSLLERYSVLAFGWRALANLLFARDALFVLRVPGKVSFLVGFFCLISRKDYVVELVTDPAESLKKVASGSPVVGAIGPMLVWLTRVLCARAVGVSYVTEYHLQTLYPANTGAIASHYSSLDSINKEETYVEPVGDRLSLITVSQLDRPFKGTRLLIDAFAQLLKRHPSATLTIVGGGILLPELCEYVSSLGLDETIKFTGRIGNKDVFEMLKNHRFYISTSFKEGLPRGVIEAMHAGLLVAATDVGGTRELIPSNRLFEPGSTDLACNAMDQLLATPRKKYKVESFQNFERSLDFDKSILAKRRRQFFSDVKGRL